MTTLSYSLRQMMRFKLLGTRISVSYWAVALLTLGVLTSAKGSYTIPLCLVSSFLHELGHLYMMHIFGRNVRSVSVSPFEISIKSDTKVLSKSQEILITVAGVAVNFFLSLIAFIFLLFFDSNILFDIIMCNLCIGVFNLLPIRSLDGGQLLSVLLCDKFAPDTCDKIMNILSVILIIPIATAGYYVLFVSRYNYSILFIAVYLTLAIISKEMR